MRVLLFVQTGDARPKCVKTPGWLGAGDAQHVREMAEGHATPDSPHWIQVLDHADRWWLVECANAEEGRLLIAQLAISESLRTVPGRVLASGGKGGAASSTRTGREIPGTARPSIIRPRSRCR